MTTYKDLKVYQDSMLLVTKIYSITADFPNNEVFGLTSQIRRCAVSIPSNITEGAVRNHVKENVQFLYVALGSACEMETQIQISCNLGYIKNQEFQTISASLHEIIKMLNGMIRYQKSLLNAK